MLRLSISTLIRSTCNSCSNITRSRLNQIELKAKEYGNNSNNGKNYYKKRRDDLSRGWKICCKPGSVTIEYLFSFSHLIFSPLLDQLLGVRLLLFFSSSCPVLLQHCFTLIWLYLTLPHTLLSCLFILLLTIMVW